MTVIFKKSFLQCKEVRQFVRKSRLDEFKRRILDHLDALETKERKKAKKSAEALCARETMSKAGYPVGTIREWKGKKYVKTAPGKWRPKYDSDSLRGAKQSIAAIKKKVNACATAEELLQVVKENKHRFTDESGQYLPFVKELFGHVSEKKKEIRGGAKQGKAEAGKGKQSLKDLANGFVTAYDPYELGAQIKKYGKNEKLYNSKIRKMCKLRDTLVDIHRNYSNDEEVRAATVELGERAGYLAQQLHSPKLAKFARDALDYAQEHSFTEIRDAERKFDMEHGLDPDTHRPLRQAEDSKKDGKAAGAEKESGKQASGKQASGKGKEEKPAVVRSPGIMKIRAKYEASPSVEGRKKTVVLPNGEKVKCHYRIVEADAPTASHDEVSFSPTEGFPTNENGKNINDRDYEHDTDAQEAVRRIAAGFNALALDSPPIVTKDGIVVSGNNRTMSSKLAARNGTDSEYLESLREMAEEYGLEESDIAGFKHPRLILEVDAEHEGDYTTQEFAAYNQDTKKTMNNVEKAVKLTKTLDAEKIKGIAGCLDGYETMGELYQDRKGGMKFVQELVKAGVILDNEKAQYLTSDGLLNDTGKDFVETVLVGSVLNEDNIRRCDGAGGKSIRKKLVRAILPLIENKGNGNEYSFNAELNEAVGIALEVSKNHSEFGTVKDFLDQQSLFSDKKVDAVTARLAEVIHDGTEKAFAARMKNLGAGLRESAEGTMDIFLGGVESKDSLMRRFLEVKKAVAAALQRAFGFLGKSA